MNEERDVAALATELRDRVRELQREVDADREAMDYWASVVRKAKVGTEERIAALENVGRMKRQKDRSVEARNRAMAVLMPMVGESSNED